MLNIKPLTLGLYETNCYIIWAQDSPDCLVIDPGYEPETVLREAAGLNKQISAILLTHGHFDHVGGVRTIFQETDCDIYLNPEDCNLPEQLTAGPLCYTCSYQPGSTLHLAGLDIEVLPTPGHTPGCVCLLCEDAMFSGDTLFAGSCGRTDFPGGSWPTLSESLRKLTLLDKNYRVFPGHGSSTTLENEKKYNPYLR